MFYHEPVCPSKKRLIDTGALADYPNMAGLASGTCKDHKLLRVRNSSIISGVGVDTWNDGYLGPVCV